MIIISDSSCDIWSLDGGNFTTVPLEIFTEEKHYLDDETMDVDGMLDYLESYKGRSYTACPSTEEWLKRFGEEDEIYVVTMTGTLSGTYNSASCAKNMYLESHPNAKILIVDTLSTSGEQLLIIEKIYEYKKMNLSFEEVEKEIAEYQKRTRLLFAFHSLHNFAQNGRVPKILAQAIGALGISIVGTASEEGEVKPLGKCRGRKRILQEILKRLEDFHYTGGKINICHVQNESLAKEISYKIKEKYETAKIHIYPARGICAYYGERGGIIMGCECN